MRQSILDRFEPNFTENHFSEIISHRFLGRSKMNLTTRRKLLTCCYASNVLGHQPFKICQALLRLKLATVKTQKKSFEQKVTF